jgi:[CysO sulfur-carrier protein]-S-L-cysteine hydrolase
MGNTQIHISRKLTQQLLHLAQSSPDKEICGLIGAKDSVPCCCYPVENSAQHAQAQFLLDSKQHIAAVKAMREKGETLFAVFHSHPTAAAVPSQKDIDSAAEENVLQLIISLNTKGVLEMRGFKIENQQMQEVILVLG